MTDYSEEAFMIRRRYSRDPVKRFKKLQRNLQKFMQKITKFRKCIYIITQRNHRIQCGNLQKHKKREKEEEAENERKPADQEGRHQGRI